MKEFSTGDTVLCPHADDSRIDLERSVGIVVRAEISETAVINARGELHFYHPTEIELISSYKQMLYSITQQGVDLVDRVNAR